MCILTIDLESRPPANGGRLSKSVTPTEFPHINLQKEGTVMNGRATQYLIPTVQMMA